MFDLTEKAYEFPCPPDDHWLDSADTFFEAGITETESRQSPETDLPTESPSLEWEERPRKPK